MMQSVDLAGGDVRFAGVVELESSPGGLTLHRLPLWTRGQHNDAALAGAATIPSGGRIEFETDAGGFELDVQLTLIQPQNYPLPPAAFDLVVDGEIIDSQRTTDGTRILIDTESGAIDIVPGGPTTMRFTLPVGHKRVELWLPHGSLMTLLAMRASGTVSRPSGNGVLRWSHYGSSISQCLEAERPTETWPAVAARLAGLDLQNFAFAGQCHLDPFVARTIAEHPADLISLKVGINVVNDDTMRERTFLPALHGFLDTVRAGHPTVPILVVTPISCPVAEDHPGPTVLVDGRLSVIERSAALGAGSLTLRRIRELEREAVAARQPDDPKLFLLEGTELLGPDDVDDLPDGLHPSPEGYRRMGRRFHSLAFGPGGAFSSS